MLDFDPIRRALGMGCWAPFHGRAPVDDAEQIACAVLYNLNDRGGIKDSFCDIDDDVRLEIVQSLAALIREGMKGGMPKPHFEDAQAYPAMMAQLRAEFGRG